MLLEQLSERFVIALTRAVKQLLTFRGIAPHIESPTILIARRGTFNAVMVCRKLNKGSRLLVTLNVNTKANAQINYGTGKDVSDEDISDAKIPSQVEWQNDSYVKIPLWK